MATAKLNSQDRKDLDKFTKYFVYKSVQIIVQSRLGEKVQTKSKPFSSGSDWFNLAIKDIPEVLAEVKKALANQTIRIGQAICVEISLKTAEGDTMVLESWQLGMTDQCDNSARVSYTVYNRMGILLKSLLCVTRVTPAYRLSRKQGAETYVICYRIYLGEPQVANLGDGHSKVKVGTVPTPAGKITMNVAYRTKLLISPQKTCRDLVFEVKDDHFKPDASPKRTTTPKPCHQGYHKDNSIPFYGARAYERRQTEPALLGLEGSRGLKRRLSLPFRNYNASDEDIPEAGEYCATSFSTSPLDPYLHNYHCFQQHSPRTPPSSSSSSTPPVNIQRHPSNPDTINKNDDYRNHSALEKQGSLLHQVQKIGAFAPQRPAEQSQTPPHPQSDLDDIPFMALLQPLEEAESSSSSGGPSSCKQQHESTSSGSRDDVDSDDRSDNNNITKSTESHGSMKSNGSEASAPEDFVMVELKTPFAATDANTDLGRFYKDCQGAPQLIMFDSQPTIEEALEDISEQLALFESNVEDFDMFVESVQPTE